MRAWSGMKAEVRHEGAVGQVQPSQMALDRQLRYCPTRLGIEWKGAAKLRQMPMTGCHEQSSLNCTRHDPFIMGWATAGPMVRPRLWDAGRRPTGWDAAVRHRDLRRRARLPAGLRPGLKWLRNGGQLRLRQMRQRSNCVRWCRIHHRQGGQ